MTQTRTRTRPACTPEEQEATRLLAQAALREMVTETILLGPGDSKGRTLRVHLRVGPAEAAWRAALSGAAS